MRSGDEAAGRAELDVTSCRGVAVLNTYRKVRHNMLKTRVTELLGIKYPIIQGGMAWVAEATLAAAVSNAGGLGLIAGGSAPADVIRNEIRRARELTDKPFGLNIMLMSEFAADLAQLVIDEGVKVVTTGAGSPGVYMDAWKKAGVIVIPVVPAAVLAVRMERLGADAVVAEGCEAGGHIGEMTTMALVPQVVDAVSIPVIAAGGIADGRGVAAALMLGAQGVQCGTCFLTCEECLIHDNYKDMVIEAKDVGTAVTGRTVGLSCRVLKSPSTRNMLDKEREGISREDFEAMNSGALRKAVKDGNVQEGSFMAGQIAGLIKGKTTCKAQIEGMFARAEELLHG